MVYATFLENHNLISSWKITISSQVGSLYRNHWWYISVISHQNSYITTSVSKWLRGSPSTRLSFKNLCPPGSSNPAVPIPVQMTELSRTPTYKWFETMVLLATQPTHPLYCWIVIFFPNPQVLQTIHTFFPRWFPHKVVQFLRHFPTFWLVKNSHSSKQSHQAPQRSRCSHRNHCRAWRNPCRPQAPGRDECFTSMIYLWFLCFIIHWSRVIGWNDDKMMITYQ